MLRYTAFQDVGLALNPTAVEGQIEGSVVQGLGWALTEGFDYGPDGRLRNASLLDYRMPTALDVPRIECVIVETPVPNVPYGVRGVGEVPIVPPAAAVANAIARATGARMTQDANDTRAGACCPRKCQSGSNPLGNSLAELINTNALALWPACCGVAQVARWNGYTESSMPVVAVR